MIWRFTIVFSCDLATPLIIYGRFSIDGRERVRRVSGKPELSMMAILFAHGVVQATALLLSQSGI